MRALLIPVILASSTVVALGAEPKATDGLRPGDKAPKFALKGSDGKTYKSDELLGKKKAIVLAWFPKAFTGGCTVECTSFREDGAGLRQFDVAYFTASCDTAEQNTKFAKSLKLDYPILSDPEKKVARAFGVVDEKRTNPHRWTFYIGADGKILHIDKSVKTKTHGQDVAKKLAELKVAKRKPEGLGPRR
jgi:peroxiredoxin Q/BCP